MATILWSVGTVRAGQRFNPIVVHVDKDGNVSFPGRNDAKVPEGYEKKTLTTFAAARQFTKEFNQRENVKAEIRQQEKTEQFEAMQRQNRGELRQMMQGFSQKGRDFANFAMKQNDMRKKRPTEINGYFEVAEFDSSNRMAQCDAATDWKPRGK